MHMIGDDTDEEKVAEEAAEYLQSDTHLGPTVKANGPLRLDPSDDLFERLVISILRQQVSMASAKATRERLFEAVDVTPEGILASNQDTLREAGLSQQKARYVREVAQTFTEEGYSKEYFAEHTDEEIVDTLTDITGVGPWTARMQLLFTFSRPDVFPIGDLGIRKGMQGLFGEDITRSEMRDRAEEWAPYRSYASLYLWHIEDD